LRIFDKLPRLVVKGISFTGELACRGIEFVASVFVFFRLGENLLSFFHQVIQHALPLLIDSPAWEAGIAYENRTSQKNKRLTLSGSLTLQHCMQDAGRKTSEKDTSAEFR
jgi:hypothetical protein